MDDSMQNGLTSECSEKEICDLLTYFSRNTYSAISNDEPRSYLGDVIKLMERDYIILKIQNKDGVLCNQYPAVIPIMESARSVTTIYEHEDVSWTGNLDAAKTVDLFEGAKLARCRQRFPVPVILLNGKYVCRSSTLASEPEICYRTGLINVPGYELLHSVREFWWPTEGLGPHPEIDEEAPAGPGPYDNDVRTQTMCDRVRTLDIKLLKFLNVNTIVDIMVEKRKVKHNLYVSASEKVDLKRYGSFKLISLPYPGCEFFKDYHDAMFNAEGLKYNWEHPANDAVISVPIDNVKKNLLISWMDYKEWDLILITQNYMKYIIKRLQEDNSGLLLHCISGWDRTPLFISLLRLSLWADFLVHPSLNEYEILYLTLAYDWYLFGHHLSNRLFKKEEIMAFCFDFLQYITSEDFSAKTSKKKHSDENIKTDDSRSPSRSSNSSSANTDDFSSKKKKVLPNDYLHMEMNENSNDSGTIPMDLVFEDSNSPPAEEAMDAASVTTNGSKISLLPEDTVMDNFNIDDLGKSKVLSPTSVMHRRTSPIPVGGAPSRRQRSESTGSNTSSISVLSSNWQMISDCGSVERDINFKPQRLQRLEKVRMIFNSCYQKSVKNESFGPPKKWMIEELVGNLSQLSNWLDIYPDARADIGKNGNFVQDSKQSLNDLMETNGNSSQNGGDDMTVTQNGSDQIVADHSHLK